MEHTVTQDPVKDYLRKIGETPLLTAEQEVDLTKSIEVGLFAEEKLRSGENLPATLIEELEWLAEDGRRAKTHMQKANLRLVVSMAKRFTGRGVQFLDLIQEGNIGLVRAVEKFDYEKGFKFSTYATWWIRQALERALAQQARSVRLPVHVVEQLNKLWSIKRTMILDLHREPTPAELAKELDISEEKLIELQGHGRDVISLDTPIGDDDDQTLGDFIEDAVVAGPSESSSHNVLKEEIQGALCELNERDRLVIELRFGLRDGCMRNLADVGQHPKVGLTAERVRQIQRAALMTLKERCPSLREFLQDVA